MEKRDERAFVCTLRLDIHVKASKYCFQVFSSALDLHLRKRVRGVKIKTRQEQPKQDETRQQN